MKIPTFFSEQRLPVPSTPRIPGGAFVSPLAALGDVGEILGRALDAHLTVLEKRRQADQAVLLQKLSTLYEEQMAGVLRSLEEKPDPRTYARTMADSSARLKEGFLSLPLVQNDPDLQRALEHHLEGAHRAYVLKALNREHQLFVETRRAEVNQGLEDLVRLTTQVDLRDEQRVARLKGQGVGVIEAARVGGLLSAPEAQRIQQEFTHRFDMAVFQRHMDLDPQQAAASLDLGRYPDLKPEERPALREAALRLWRQRQTEQEREQEKAKKEELERAKSTIAFQTLRGQIRTPEDLLHTMENVYGAQGIQFTDEDIHRARSFLQSVQREVAAETEKALLNPLKVEIVSAKTPAELRAVIGRMTHLVSSGRVSAEDISPLMVSAEQRMELLERREAAQEDRRLAFLRQRHAQAEQELTQILSISGPGALLLQEGEQAVKFLALQDLDDLVNRGEDPLPHVPEIAAKYLRSLKGNVSELLSTIDQQLLYPTPKELENKAPKLSPIEYERQIRLLYTKMLLLRQSHSLDRRPTK